MCVHTCSNRSVPVSKLEVLFEAETLAEKDKFDEGTDVSTQAPALHRLGGKILKKRHSEKVCSKVDIHGSIATFLPCAWGAKCTFAQKYILCGMRVELVLLAFGVCVAQWPV